MQVGGRAGPSASNAAPQPPHGLPPRRIRRAEIP
jgi:hypothetical protein